MPDLTIDQVAKELCINPETARILANRGKLRGAYKTGLGGRTSPWRVPATALDTYRKAQPGGYRP